MPIFAPGATYLGGATLGGSNANVGPVIFGPGWGMLFIAFYVAGYGGTDIMQLRLGVGATVDTGTNYSHFSHHVTTSATLPVGVTTVSTTGIRCANDGVTNSRSGMFQVHNGAVGPKIVHADTSTYAATTNTAATAYASQSFVDGRWFNNAQAQCAGLNGGVGGQTLNSGTWLSVYGIPGGG